MWLEGLGLGQYAQTFADNAIDEHLLGELTDTDLKELGVVALGHRKALLKAIEAPPAGVGPSREAPTVDTDSNLAAWERQAGERKPVTMMFADITGSTALPSECVW
ncbi:MAG: class 3 adenylate cyclase [Gammaproteobacteria bacterium]